MEKSSKLPDKEAVRDIENYLKAPNMEEKKVEFEQFMKKNKNFSSMEAKDKLHAWRIFAKAANANNQAFNLTRDWQKTHLLHLTKCLDNIKNGLPPPANHELAEMDLVKKNNIELSAYN